ncbi:MAG: hypothetical protein K6A92_10015 [Lachnospiraceae bacterium]|nr:hypothetical protein [Lachnospiraceae bacterium]
MSFYFYTRLTCSRKTLDILLDDPYNSTDLSKEYPYINFPKIIKQVFPACMHHDDDHVCGTYADNCIYVQDDKVELYFVKRSPLSILVMTAVCKYDHSSQWYWVDEEMVLTTRLMWDEIACQVVEDVLGTEIQSDLWLYWDENLSEDPYVGEDGLLEEWDIETWHILKDLNGSWSRIPKNKNIGIIMKSISDYLHSRPMIKNTFEIVKGKRRIKLFELPYDEWGIISDPVCKQLVEIMGYHDFVNLCFRLEKIDLVLPLINAEKYPILCYFLFRAKEANGTLQYRALPIGL